jgi:hypothetical protein
VCVCRGGLVEAKEGMVVVGCCRSIHFWFVRHGGPPKYLASDSSINSHTLSLLYLFSFLSWSLVVRCYPCHLGEGWLVGRGGFLIADCDVCSPLNPPQPDGLSLFLSVNPIRRRRNGGIKKGKRKKIRSRPTAFVVRYLPSGREISLWCLVCVCVCVCVCHNSGGRSRRLWRATIIELFQTW